MQNPDSTPIWFELNTADEAKAQHFYAATTCWMIG
jgi:predicted enzyme related to lactoylglutathione lyase